jgi:hypothetical protein
LFGGQAWAQNYDRIFLLNPEELDELVIEAGTVRLNNFTVAEKKDFLLKDMSLVRFTCAAMNRSQAPKHFILMVAGMDSEQKPLWADSISPLMNLIDGKQTVALTGNLYTPSGTLSQTKYFWLRVVGNVEEEAPLVEKPME